MLKSYDLFFPEPGVEKEMRCSICGTLCEVKRNVNVASSSVEAMAGIRRKHDVFTCPHAEAEWHEKALALYLESRETPSKRIAALIKKDLNEVVRKNGVRG